MPYYGAFVGLWVLQQQNILPPMLLLLTHTCFVQEVWTCLGNNAIDNKD